MNDETITLNEMNQWARDMVMRLRNPPPSFYNQPEYTPELLAKRREHAGTLESFLPLRTAEDLIGFQSMLGYIESSG